MTNTKTLNQDFFKTWSSHMAYILGYFAADGCMIRNKSGGCYIEFTTIDKVLVEQVRRATCSRSKISVRKLNKVQYKQQFRIQIGSRVWFEDLESLGFSERKSKALSLPFIPRAYVGDFVRGYFDGDGCVYFKLLQFRDRKRKRWILQTLFTSGSRRYLFSLWNILRKNGISGGSLKKKTRGFELVFSHKDSLALYHFMYHTAHTTGLYLPRKRKKLERAIQVLQLK